jgi:hypothetical protein
LYYLFNKINRQGLVVRELYRALALFVFAKLFREFFVAIWDSIKADMFWIACKTCANTTPKTTELSVLENGKIQNLIRTQNGY